MLALLSMSALLGVTSFACGMAPLYVSLTKSSLLALTTVGTGLLLGTALGVIIPEGVEALLSASLETEQVTRRVALSLVVGFFVMLLIEELVSKHSHDIPSDLPMHVPSSVEFDAELNDIENDQSASARPHTHMHTAAREKAFPLTFGLVIHSIADGLALGVSFFSGAEESSSLSLIVFLAIIVHKAPTSLALTTSLLGMTLPPADCRKHLAAFAATTPIAAITTYALLNLFGGLDHADWTGVVMVFSGGTFLYVATVLQPVSQQQEMGGKTRVALITLGMMIPLTLALGSVGHGH